VEIRLRAVNPPSAENLIHDDDFARLLGYRGGLVPGVDLYAYLALLPQQAWGAAWLAGGTMWARFAKPVYDGEEVLVRATERPGGLDLELRNPADQVCVVGSAEPVDAEPPPALARYPAAPLPPDPGPPSFSEGQPLGSLEGPLEVPDAAWPVREANRLLKANARLAPWIHVESRVRYLAPAGEGEQISVRGSVARLWERRGHRYCELDVAVVSATGDPLAVLRHVTIYELAGST
jgi:hypothetical protein